MYKALPLTLISLFALHAADLAPALQWVAVTGGDGNNSVSSAAADASGNLYIVGSTASFNFPTLSAAQPMPGGSTLVRVNLAAAVASRLFPANLPPIATAAADPRNPNTLYAASANQVWKSTDAGGTWTLISQFPSGSNIFSLAVDPSNSLALYAGTPTRGVFKSTDAGVTWTQFSNGLPHLSNGDIYAGYIWADPSSPNTLFAAAGVGFARSTDGANSWTLVPGVESPLTLAFDPLSPGTLYLAGNNSFNKSTDHGQTFTPITRLPKQIPPTAIAPDPQHAGVLFAGNFNGLYESDDAGVTWNLKLAGQTSVLVADPSTSTFYANVSGYGIVKSTDGFATTSPIGPNQPSIRQLLLAGPNLFEISASSKDVFAVKLDNDGNIVYATYFGGSGDDTAAASALGPDGSLYVTGSTTSADFPVTPGAYVSQLPSNTGSSSSYLFKLNPDGSLAWATYFTAGQSTAAALAVDSSGTPYVGGYTSGNHPTTPGVYQTSFQQTLSCTGFIGCFPGPTSAFVTRFNSQGTGLIFSTYVPTDNANNTVQSAKAMVVDAGGNVWIGVSTNPNIIATGSSPSVVELNSTGSAVLASATQPGIGTVAALALDPDSNVYVTGNYNTFAKNFPATPGAFQSAPQPAVPTLPYQIGSGGGQDAFVAKFDSSLTHLLAATLLGGEQPDTPTSLAINASGTVIVAGYTDSKAFPTHAPFQESFSSRSGFVAGFDASLSNLLFSTYLGDTRPFAAQAAVPDGKGNLLVAGSTLNSGGSFLGGDNGASFTVGAQVIANKIALPQAPAVRLDSVQNVASHLPDALSPGEPVMALGAGFGDGAQLVLDGTPIDTLSATGTSIMAVIPDTAPTFGPHTLQVSSGGALSNSVYALSAPASPAIYSVDGTGAGQAYILNSDGPLNSPANPAAPGSIITIFASGPGQYTLSNGYAVTAQTPAVFIDGFYADGVAATIGPVQGLPGNVYQLSVRVPDPTTLVANNPDLKNFKFPAQSSVLLIMGPPNSSNPANSGTLSQNGIYINIQ